MADFRFIIVLVFLPFVVSNSQPRRRERTNTNRSPVEIQSMRRGNSDPNSSPFNPRSWRKVDLGSNKSPVGSRSRRKEDSGPNRPSQSDDWRPTKLDSDPNSSPFDSRSRRKEDSGPNRPTKLDSVLNRSPVESQSRRRETSILNRSQVDSRSRRKGDSGPNRPSVDLWSRRDSNRSPVEEQSRRRDSVPNRSHVEEQSRKRDSVQNRSPVEEQSRRRDSVPNRSPVESQSRRRESSIPNRSHVDSRSRRKGDSGPNRPSVDLWSRRESNRSPVEEQSQRRDSVPNRSPVEEQSRKRDLVPNKSPVEEQSRRRESSIPNRSHVDLRPGKSGESGQKRPLNDLQHLKNRRTCNREDPTPIRDIKLLSIQGRWFAPNLIFSKTFPEYRTLDSVSDFSLDFNESGVVIIDASVPPPWNKNQRVCIYEKVFFSTLDASKNAFIMHSKFFNRTMEWRLLKTDWGRSYLLTWTCVLKINGICADFMSHIHSRTPHYLTQGQLQKINRYIKRTLCLDYRDYTADPLKTRCKRYKDLVKLGQRANKFTKQPL